MGQHRRGHGPHPAGRRASSAHAVTFPLLTTSSGAKMGKTASGALWLDAERTSPYDFYQYWINTEDPDVERFLGLFTFLPMDEVRRLGHSRARNYREAKEVLAFEVTKLCHGKPRLKRPARRAARSSAAARTWTTCPPSRSRRARPGHGRLRPLRRRGARQEPRRGPPPHRTGRRLVNGEVVPPSTRRSPPPTSERRDAPACGEEEVLRGAARLTPDTPDLKKAPARSPGLFFVTEP